MRASIVRKEAETQTVDADDFVVLYDEVDGHPYKGTAADVVSAANQAKVETVTATNVITAAENGTTFFLSAATEFVSTLPAPAAGLKYSFYVAAAPSSASYTIVSNGGDNVIVGHVVSSEDAAGSGDFEASGGDTITLVDSKAVVGDRVDVISDGTKWYVSAFCSVQDAITITGT